jgi:hypothetical protein
MHSCQQLEYSCQQAVVNVLVSIRAVYFLVILTVLECLGGFHAREVWIELVQLRQTIGRCLSVPFCFSRGTTNQTAAVSLNAKCSTREAREDVSREQQEIRRFCELTARVELKS